MTWEDHRDLRLGSVQVYNDSSVPLSDLQIVSKQIIMAATALFLYEYALTIYMEMVLIWRRRFTGANILYFLMRYSSLSWVLLVLAASQVAVMDPKICKGTYITYGVLTVISLAAVRITFLLRTYALRQRSVLVLIFLIPIALANVILNVRVVIIAKEPLIHFASSSNGSCAIKFPPGGRTPSYIVTLLYDTIVFALTLSRAMEIVKKTSPFGLDYSLTTIIIRDGSLYYGMVILLDVLAICVDVIKKTPQLLAEISWDFLNILQVIFTARLVLNLHLAGYCKDLRMRDAHLSNLAPSTATTGARTDLTEVIILGDLAEPFVTDDRDWELEINESDRQHASA